MHIYVDTNIIIQAVDISHLFNDGISENFVLKIKNAFYTVDIVRGINSDNL